MSNLLHVCVYDADAKATQGIIGPIQALNFVRVVAEVETPEQLATVLHEGAANLIFFHLDPDSQSVVGVIDQVSSRYPDVALIAISHQTDPTSILAPMRAGCDQFVCEPIDADDLATAVSRVTSKRLLSQPRSRCICVTGSSGGAGTTSIACNLALEIAQLTERECALVDLDLPFGDVALNFDTEPKYNIHDLAVAGDSLDPSILTSTLMTLPCKVALLTRPEHLEQNSVVTPDTVHRVVELLMAAYENIVIDVPRDLSTCSSTAMGVADTILVVCQLSVPSIRNAKRYYDALRTMGIPEERIEIVVNRSDGRSGRVTLKDIDEIIQRRAFACIPNDYQFVARSIDFGQPIASLDKNNPVRAAIRAMAQTILSGRSADTTKKDARRGFLSRLLTK